MPKMRNTFTFSIIRNRFSKGKALDDMKLSKLEANFRGFKFILAYDSSRAITSRITSCILHLIPAERRFSSPKVTSTITFRNFKLYNKFKCPSLRSMQKSLAIN